MGGITDLVTIRSLLYAIRRSVYKDNDKGIENLFSLGFLGAFSVLLSNIKDEDALAEAAWCLVNISANPSYTESIIELDIHRKIITLLKEGVVMSQEGFMIVLGNIMSDEVHFQDKELVQDLTNYILKQLERNVIPIQFLKIISWLLSRFSYVNAFSNNVVIYNQMNKLLAVEDTEVTASVLKAFANITSKDKSLLKKVHEAINIERLINLIKLNDTQIIAIRVLGNLCKGPHECVDEIAKKGGFDLLQSLLSNTGDTTLQWEICRALSNVTSEPNSHTGYLLNSNVFPKLFNLCKDGVADVRKEAAWAIANASIEADKEQSVELIKMGVISALAKGIEISNPTLQELIMWAIDNLLSAGISKSGENHLSEVFEAEGGIELLEGLYMHMNEDIQKKAKSMMQKYFPNKEESDLLGESIMNLIEE